MVRDGRKDLVLTIHEVTSVIDGGAFVARSHRVPISEGVNAIQMHRITWPQMGSFIQREVGAILEPANRVSANAPMVVQEEAVAYRTASRRQWAERLAA